MGNIASKIAELSITLPAVLLAITVHEFAHGWLANRLGDPTARLAGRLNLNPFSHLDLIGGLALLIFHFGWAKPVPINPLYFRNPRRGILLTSLAGPLANLLTAGIAALGYRGLILLVLSLSSPPPLLPKVLDPFIRMLMMAVIINVALFVFNLLPIPPLDGSKVVMGLLPPAQATAFGRLEPYGIFVLMILILVGAIEAVIWTPAALVIRILIGS
jgi:Zn-dependent protease